MATRHQARQAVVSLLYSRQMGTNSAEFLQEFLDDRKIRNQRRDEVVETFEQICAKSAELDAILEQNLKDGRAAELSCIDLCILRLGIYELKTGKIDKAIVINEAIELAKELGSDGSPRLVNAILDAVKSQL